MAFLDKLSSIAKDVTDKAGDAVEITKLKAKVNKEKSAIEDSVKKIGEYYLEKYLAGETSDETLKVMCEEIAAKNKNIEEIVTQIASVKE